MKRVAGPDREPEWGSREADRNLRRFIDAVLNVAIETYLDEREAAGQATSLRHLRRRSSTAQPTDRAA